MIMILATFANENTEMSLFLQAVIAVLFALVFGNQSDIIQLRAKAEGREMTGFEKLRYALMEGGFFVIMICAAVLYAFSICTGE